MSYHHGNLREALLQRAADVIAERGVDGLSLRALARDLGVSNAAPRRHFADRSALLAELACQGFRNVREKQAEAAEAAGDDPIARYRALGRSYVTFARENRSYFLAATHPSVLAEVDDDLREEQAMFFANLAEAAAAARAAGWHSDIETEALLAFSVAGAMGAAQLFSDPHWCSIMGIDDSNADALADQVLDLLVHRNRRVEVSEKTKPRKTAAVKTARPPSRRKL